MLDARKFNLVIRVLEIPVPHPPERGEGLEIEFKHQWIMI